MKKNFLKELILPAFWLFFFTVSSKSDAKINEIKKPGASQVKLDVSTPGASHAFEQNRQATFTKALFLSKY